MSPLLRALASVTLLLAATSCRQHDSARAASATGELTLHVSILGDPTDARIPPAREALSHWNGELARLGLTVRFDTGVVVRSRVPEAELRAASASKMKLWGWWADARLRSALSSVPGDVVIALSRTDLISFSVPLRRGGKGVVGVRRADVSPLSLPNTVRNVVAHELGHVLGLSHNADSTTLMCGRPAPCRPALFASDSSHFFPLTTEDERSLRGRLDH